MLKIKKKCPRCTGQGHHLLVAIFIVIMKIIDAEIIDFISVNSLDDGEIETRIYYKGISAKETSIGNGTITDLHFRQLTNGKHFIQLIYSDHNPIKDCEFGHQRDQIKKFLYDFKNDLNRLITTSNLSVISLDDKKLPVEYNWMNYTQLRRDCHRRHLEMKKDLEMEKEMRNNELINQRWKRDISDIFRVPGTKWCGKGYSADKYTRVGGFSKTDKCCRRHDLFCPFWIGGFETKYGLFNWRLNTLMHCNCDDRFRACLKTAGTSAANLVGKLFFNIVQTKCFILKPRKKCVRTTWWGKCQKYKMLKQAVVKNNKPY